MVARTEGGDALPGREVERLDLVVVGVGDVNLAVVVGEPLAVLEAGLPAFAVAVPELEQALAN